MGSGRRSATMSITLRPNLNFATKADNTSVNWDELKGRLSSFQVDKLTYFFTQFFDHNQDGVIDSKDFAEIRAHHHHAFLDLVSMAATNPCMAFSLNSWLHMWARMCKGAAGIDDFPIWVQLIPRVIFNVICSKEGGLIISRSSLRNFYENFTGLSGDTLEKVSTEGFRSMSANGDYELDWSSYKLLFSNFLLGRTIYGPGKYVFGCFDNSDMTEKYKIDYNG